WDSLGVDDDNAIVADRPEYSQRIAHNPQNRTSIYPLISRKTAQVPSCDNRQTYYKLQPLVPKHGCTGPAQLFPAFRFGISWCAAFEARPMKRFVAVGVLAVAFLILLVGPIRAYVDVSPTLGYIIKDSTSIAVIQIDKVSVEKRGIIFKKVADLKGSS